MKELKTYVEPEMRVKPLVMSDVITASNQRSITPEVVNRNRDIFYTYNEDDDAVESK